MTAAGDDTRRTIDQYCSAWVRGDAAALVSLYADDIVLHWFGENPLAGDHAGREAALAALGRLSRAVEREAPEIHAVLVDGGHAAVLARERWRVRGDRRELERVLVYHVRDGKLAECWVYDADQRAVDEMLREA